MELVPLILEVWRKAYSMTSRQKSHDPDMAKKHTNSDYLQSTLSPQIRQT